jgi:CPA2 family monovalent cation:H+ antiporter-2
MNIILFNDILIIFLLAIAILLLFHKLRLPAIVGFLITGVIAGPHGLRLVQSVDDVRLLAEIGIVLLLFTIGIEFSLKRFLQIKKSVLLGGSLQVLFTVMVGTTVASVADMPFGQAVFIGFLLSLSSTAIVLILLKARAQIESPQGRTVLAILIFQDVIIVPMMLITPVLAGTAAQTRISLPFIIIGGIGLILLIVFGTKWIVPQFLYHIARTRSRELFLLSVVVLCFAIARLTSSLGLSLALGAFLAGLIISESEYGHEALGHVLPFRDVFTSLFFVSVGMLLDIHFVLDRPILILMCTVGVFLAKTIAASGAVLIIGFPLRMSILAGLALCQVGEFSFVLSTVGLKYGLLSGDLYQLFLAVSIVTMALTPFLLDLAPRLSDIVLLLPIPKRLRMGAYPMQEQGGPSMRDHVIIIGFGINGRNVARAAEAANIPYVIIEMNPDTVLKEKAAGEPIYYGDATQEAVLSHAGIRSARVLAISIYDAPATRRIVELARRFNPKVYVIARTRFVQEMPELYKLGADEVIPEEFETSIEIFSRVLKKFLVPRHEIEKFVADVRADGYEMFRSLSKEPTAASDLKLALSDVEISILRVSERSPLAGKSLKEIDMRKNYGLTVLGIRRNAQIMSNPDGEVKLFPNDKLIILGSPEKIAAVASLFEKQDEMSAE